MGTIVTHGRAVRGEFESTCDSVFAYRKAAIDWLASEGYAMTTDVLDCLCWVDSLGNVAIVSDCPCED